MKLLYCLKCQKIKESINPRATKINYERKMLLTKYAVCDGNKLRFIKKQERSGLLCN